MQQFASQKSEIISSNHGLLLPVREPVLTVFRLPCSILVIMWFLKAAAWCLSCTVSFSFCLACTACIS